MLLKFLYLFFLYLPFQFAINASSDVDLASVRLLVIIMFFLWLLQGLKNKKIIIRSNKLTVLIFLFLIINVFSLFFAENIFWGMRKLMFLLSFFPLYFIISDLIIQKKLNFRTILKYLVFGSFLVSLIGLIQFILQFIFGIEKTYSLWEKIITPFLGHSFSNAVFKNPSWLVNIKGHTFLRATAFFPDPHIFSFFLGMIAPIALSLFVESKNKFFGVSFFLILFVDFLTFSRGGYLGIFFGMLFFIIFSLKQNLLYSSKKQDNRKRFKNSLFFGLMAVAFIYLFIISNPITSRFLSSFNLNDGSNAGRILIWKKSLSIIFSRPFIGVGLGNYPLSIKPSANYREPIYAHSAYLDIASETGILNFLFWFFIIIIAITNHIKKYQRNNQIIYLGISSGLVVFAVHSLFESAIFSVHILPLFILLISL